MSQTDLTNTLLTKRLRAVFPQIEISISCHITDLLLALLPLSLSPLHVPSPPTYCLLSGRKVNTLLLSVSAQPSLSVCVCVCAVGVHLQFLFPPSTVKQNHRNSGYKQLKQFLSKLWFSPHFKQAQMHFTILLDVMLHCQAYSVNVIVN